MVKKPRRLKSRQETSTGNGEMSKVEGQDFGDTEASVILDERITLKAEQAEGLRALYAARKELEHRIAFAEQMLGIRGREITGGELGDDNPHLMLKAMNGVAG